MCRLALGSLLLAGCGHQTLPVNLAVEATPARKTAIELARLNPHLSIVRIRPDGRMIEVRDRESGRSLLLPESQVRGSRVTVAACGGNTLLPTPVCLSVGARRAEYGEMAEGVAEAARRLGGEADSRFTAHFRTGGFQVYLDSHGGALTRVFAIGETSQK